MRSVFRRSTAIAPASDPLDRDRMAIFPVARYRTSLCRVARYRMPACPVSRWGLPSSSPLPPRRSQTPGFPKPSKFLPAWRGSPLLTRFTPLATCCWMVVGFTTSNSRIDIRLGSKCEDLRLSRSSPLRPTKRTLMTYAAASLMGQKRTTLATQSGQRSSGNQLLGHENATRALRQARYFAEASPSIAGIEAWRLKADRVQHGCDTTTTLPLLLSSQNSRSKTATPVLRSYVKKVKKKQPEG